MKTIGIYSRKFSNQLKGSLQHILKCIEDAGGKALIYKNLLTNMPENIKISNIRGSFETYEELKKEADFLISLGGDGTLLDALTLVRDSNIPVLGINFGRLGFLSSIDVSEIQTAIRALFENNFFLSARTLLSLRYVSDIELPPTPFAVNDITVSKKEANSMINIHAFVNGIHLNSYWADGLITATPTGSTAYSMSCAGPILTPDSRNFILTPIAPHNLSIRPMIIPDDSEIKFAVESRNRSFHLTLDSRTISLKSGSEIIIGKEEFKVKLVILTGDNFFQIIRDKLHWGTDKRN